MKLSEQMTQFGWKITEITTPDDKLGVRDFEIITHDDTQYQAYTDSSGKLHWWSILHSKEIDESLVIKKLHNEQQYVNTYNSYCVDMIHIQDENNTYLEPGQYIQCGNFVYGLVGEVYDCKLYLGREYFGNIKYCLTVDDIQDEIIRIWARWGEIVGQNILLQLMENPYHLENIRLFKYRKAIMHYYRIFLPYSERRFDFSLLVKSIQNYAEQIGYELPDELTDSHIYNNEHATYDDCNHIFNVCEQHIKQMCWIV